MSIKANILQSIEDLPIHEHAFLEPSAVTFLEEVRSMCQQNKCGKYGLSWACQPASGSLEDCKNKCLAYDQVFVFSTVAQLKKTYDMDGWATAAKEHEKVTDQIATLFRALNPETFVLSAGACEICDSCTYPDAPCRFPDRMYPAAEGYGILVMRVAKECQIKYYNGPKTVTYFSMVFFNCDDAA